jgi:ferric-dicitrate binding protein FerR (iron transport regulator)
MAVLMALAVGIGLWAAGPVAVETARGEQRTVTLPDGSVAELNGATTITYPRGFTSLPWIGHDARQVTLQGEAFFSVESASRTFQVETENARIGVRGTAFNVRMRSRSEGPVTEVTLASGQVQVQGAPQSSSIRLDEAGAQSRVVGRRAPTPPEPVEVDQVAAWRQGGFSVRNAPLPDVLRDLEAQFGVPIRLSVPAARTDSMTLHYRRVDRLEAVLRDIALVQDMQYRKLNDGYELIPLDDSASESP